MNMSPMSAMGLVLGRALLLRQLFRELGELRVEFRQFLGVFRNRRLQFLVVQMTKVSRLAMLVTLNNIFRNLCLSRAYQGRGPHAVCGGIDRRRHGDLE